LVLSLDTDLQGVIDDAATASASLATIVAGSDAVVANFDGLKDLVDSLSAFASTMKDGVFYTPTGSIMPFAGSSAPDDWYLCNGDLFATLGLSAGDPLFDLLSAAGWSGVPDLRGRTVLGAGTGAGLSARTLAATVGAETHTLGVTQIPSHKHYTSGTTSTISVDHSHSGSTSQMKIGSGTISSGGVEFLKPITASSGTVTSLSVSTGGVSANHTHTWGDYSNTSIYNNSTNAAETVNQPHNNMQPSLVLNYIIKG